MEVNSSNLIEGLYKILCTSISTKTDLTVENNDYFKRRVLGFKAEIELETLILNSQKSQFLEGGQFITKKGSTEDAPHIIYTTISYGPPSSYMNLYRQINNWDQVHELYYLEICDDNEWTSTTISTKENGSFVDSRILMPKYNIYKFNTTSNTFDILGNELTAITSNFDATDRTPSRYPLRERNNFNFFNDYQIDKVKKIYANRFFIDVFLRGFKREGLIDIDGFLIAGENITILEIKEKSPIKDEDDPTNQVKWQYGWDTRRALWFYFLKNNINIEILYCIRRINNRVNRTFEGWDSIKLESFLENVNWSKSVGGGGGETTLTVNYSNFSEPNFD